MKTDHAPVLLILFALVAAVPTVHAAESEPSFKIYAEHTGVYEVGYDRLVEAGLEGSLASASMGLRNFGLPVPVWIEDGGDGYFGPGDRVLFVGEVLRGSASYLDPYSRHNCYVLSFGDPEPLRGEDRPAADTAADEPSELWVKDHLEPDRVMVRFRSRKDDPEESWYWQRLSVADREPFQVGLMVEGLARVAKGGGETIDFADALSESIREASEGDRGDVGRIRSHLESVFEVKTTNPVTVRFRLGLRGWSEPRHTERMALPHHEIQIRLNGSVIDRVTWDGKDHFVHEVEVLAGRIRDGSNTLTLTVPKRSYPESGDMVVDVALLNWIEVEYPHDGLVKDEQLRLFPVGDGRDFQVAVQVDDGGPVDLFLSSGVRLRGLDGELEQRVDVGDSGFSVLKPSSVATPNEVILDRQANLRSGDRQVDYIMITHRTLREGAERLAELHRGRGLSVLVVDVQDIYDEFNFGVLDPRSIKDFLQHASSNWRSPAPRFVLFVGDASWDFKNTTADDANYADWTYRPGETKRFIKNSSTHYAEGTELNHRSLVPTSSYPTLEGHAASDTWFVCLDDGDDLPDMAIGRIPVVTPEELAGVVDKTIAFVSAPPVGPWRRNLLFVANESVSFQRRTDQLAETYSKLGFIPNKIYPHPTEPANEHHTRRILEILDDGALAVHFIGHGGRYIWRTGPPDLEKNHDLFTLDHLEELADNGRLPVVLSLTCYSAPFDHPTADSIGEKLIRIPRRGAIAVFAASWRNSPSPVMGERLLDELTIPGNTIGEAVMRAKRGFRSDVLIQTYNLLGDPAVPVSAPAHSLDLALEKTDDGLSLRVAMPVSVDAGWMVADWVAEDGSVLREDRVEVNGSDYSLSLDRGVLGGDERLDGVRVYVWDETRRVDGIGWVDLVADEPDEDPSVSGMRTGTGRTDAESEEEGSRD